jgi:hypothetical protein
MLGTRSVRSGGGIFFFRYVRKRKENKESDWSEALLLQGKPACRLLLTFWHRNLAFKF